MKMFCANSPVGAAAVALVLLFAAPLPAQTLTPGEARAAHALEAAKKAGAPELYAFLKPFPKGADLHMHLSGAIYAESFIAEAVQQQMCIDPVKLALVKNIGTTKSIPSQPVCAEGAVPATAALKDQALYDKLIDSFSMRSFVPSAGWSGHDQFFSTFAQFGGLKDAAGQWLDEVATRAAAQNEQYLEIMQTPTFTNAATLGYKMGWPAVTDANHMVELAKFRDALLSAGLRDEVAVDRKEFADAKTARDAIEHCGDTAIPACNIKIHWLYQVLRGYPLQQVFAQTLLGFEAASADPDVVGINFVMPEDGRISMKDYHLQMLMLDYLHSVYPKVHISLHAGELAFGMVPPEGLKFHIREAIELGHAQRIGHGMDVLYETDAAALLKEMATKRIDVEVNLTSNDVILGSKGTDHPFAAYRAAHVPYSLSTDDEGVSRTDLTREYGRAVAEQNLSYAGLKLSARDSLEYSFLSGASLWVSTGTAPQTFAHRVAACAAPIAAGNRISKACSDFLSSSEKAREQYELELRFAKFEAASR